MTFRIDIELLDEQISALLKSNMPEAERDGLHNLLGTIYDELTDHQKITFYLAEEDEENV